MGWRVVMGRFWSTGSGAGDAATGGSCAGVLDMASAVVQGLGAAPIPDRRSRVAILPQALGSVAALQSGLPAQVCRLVCMNPAPSSFFCSGCTAHCGPVSRHRSDVAGCAQPSERSARRSVQPMPSVLASDATPRCAPMASADRPMTDDRRPMTPHYLQSLQYQPLLL